ncbi:MAG: N-acetyltransferase [Litoreibacter sp.]|nr:N-acetyltransferase [Litoreibacter sp.]
MTQIRSAQPEDASAIIAIWNAIIRDTAITFTTREKSPEEIVSLIAECKTENRPFVVAETAGQVTGFATLAPFRGGPGYARTLELSVHLAPDARGQGTGRALIRALEKNAAANGCHSLIAGISGENPDAVAFHERLGFREIARLPEVGRKFDRWIDLVLLQKFL